VDKDVSVSSKAVNQMETRGAHPLTRKVLVSYLVTDRVLLLVCLIINDFIPAFLTLVMVFESFILPI
jgi:hypothetical protein